MTTSPYLAVLALAGTAAAVAVVVSAMHAAQPAAAPQPAAAAAERAAQPQPPQEEFVDPAAMAKRFNVELGRMAATKETTPPRQLIEQLQSRRFHAVETLADPGRNQDAPTIYRSARRGVVVVGAVTGGRGRRPPQGSFASGFVIHKDGLIVTNAHVVEAFAHMNGMGVMTHDQRVFPVKAVLAADRHNDVAVLKVAADDLVPLPVARTVPVGATVYCLSHPALTSEGDENAFFAFTRGAVSGRFRIDLRREGLVDVLAITSDYGQGSSGGPILNENGAVVGIVCETVSLSSDVQSCDTQMTWKFARPSSSLLALVSGQPPTK